MDQGQGIPVWQIVILIVCSLGGLISMMSQFLIANLVRRLNRHGEKIENHQDRISILETNHKNGITNTQVSFDNIEETLDSIKNQLAQQSQESKSQIVELKSVDKRITDFIIDYYKKGGESYRLKE